MRYRAEIDGLRAIALLPVMAFHAGIDAFSGGFVGVDMFFVISGYLITTILLTELKQGEFSLLRFYERRARRILPALFVVLAACLPFAWMWLLPHQLQRFSQSLAAVSIFGSNIFFWRTTGYFEISSELQPLLHTWSLSVEQQFYLFFPALLLLAWRCGTRSVPAVLGLAMLASLSLAQWGALADPTPAFYLLPTRGWELLTGAVVACYLANEASVVPGPRARAIGCLAGAGLLAYAIGMFDKHTPFPGLFALAPTMGTALLIVCATGTNLAARVLGCRSLASIGLISYSAYLWHQPLFAFARLGMSEQPSLGVMALLALLALVLAWGTWRYVEQPCRNRHVFSRAQVGRLGAAGSVVFLCAGLLGHASGGFKSRLPPNIEWETLGARLDQHGEVCPLKPLPRYPGLAACEFGDRTAARAMLLYGDSHSLAIGAELARALTASSTRGIRIAVPGCEIVPRMRNLSIAPDRQQDCPRKFQQLLAYVRATQAGLVIASRWTFKLYPIAGEITDMPSINSDGGKERDAPYREYAVMEAGQVRKDGAAKTAAVKDFLDSVLSAGVDVYVVYPVPEIAWDIGRVNYDHYQRTGTVLQALSIAHADFQRRHRFVQRIFDGYLAHPRFHAIRPEAIFCNTFIRHRCAAQFRTVPFYYDDDHLSDTGARMIVAAILQQAQR